MKKIILISLLLIFLVAGGLFAYVSQMDWNAHKEKLATQLSQVFGKKIQFSGNLRVNIFPHPQLSAADVAVINPQSGEKLANIKQLETQITLKSLLKGKPDIQDLSLDGIEVWFKFDGYGISNWHQKKKDVSLVTQGSFNIHNFNIKKSKIHIEHQKYNLAFDLDEFNANVQAGGVEGPYRLEGNFLKNNNRYGLAVSVDALSQIEDVGISVVVTHPDTESNFRYDGSYNAMADGLKGVLSGQSQKTADWLNGLLNDEVVKEVYNESLMFSTDIQSDETVTKLTDFVIKFNNLFEGAGKVDISAPQKGKKRKVDIKYQLVNLNIQAFKKVFEELFDKYQKGAKYEPDTSFDVAYDVSAERVRVSDEATGVLENVSAKGEWKDNIFSLDDFYAACPGNIVLSLKTGLAEKDGVPQYYLGANINGQNMLSFINAFGYKLKSPRQSSYRDVDINFYIQGTPKYINMEKADIKLDKANIEVASAIDLIQKEYLINVNADILNMDNYIFPLEIEENTKMADHIVNETKRFEWLKNNKADISIKAKSATFEGVSARNVDINVISDGAGYVVVENATATNMLGSDIEVSGAIKNFSENNPTFHDVTFILKSSNIKMLADKWHISIPKWPLFEQGNLLQTGVLTGDLHKIYVNTLTKSGEHTFRYDGLLNEDDNRIHFDGEAVLKTGHMENLLKLLIGNINGKIYRGPLVAKSKVKGNSKNWLAQEADIQMGIDRYKANVNVSEDKKVYKISGDVKTTDLNLLNWVNIQKTKAMPKLGSGDENTFIAKPSLSGDVINYNSYRELAVDINLTAEKSSYGKYVMNNLRTNIVNEMGDLQFKNLSFENKNHKVSGALEINYAQTPIMKGSLQIVYPKISNIGGTVYALSANDVVINTDFETSAVTVNDMIEGLKGRANISGKSAEFKGIDLMVIGEDLQSREYSKGLYQLVRDNVQRGKTAFDAFEIETQLNNGAITLSPSVLKSNNANVNLSGSINVKEWKLNNTLSVKYSDLKDIPDYSIMFSGMLNKPVVDINIEEIAKKYDEHWKKIEDEKERIEEEIRLKQKAKIDELHDRITSASDYLTSVLNDAEDHLTNHLTDDIVKKYQSKIDELNEINSGLEDAKNKTSGNITEDEIMQYFNETESSKAKIENIASEIKNYYLEDVESKKNELISNENEMYPQIVNIYNEFQSMWNEDREQLKQYNSLEYIDQNEVLKSYYNSVQQNKDSAESIHADLAEQSNRFSALETVKEKHEAVVNYIKLVEQEEKIFSEIQTLRQQTSEELIQTLDERRAVFEEKQRVEEEKRRKQAEIDAQNLLLNTNLNPVTNNTETVGVQSTDSVDNVNKKVENADALSQQSNPEYKENTPKISSSGKIITQYDKYKKEETPTVQPTGGLLKPVDGAVQKASGSIKVK